VIYSVISVASSKYVPLPPGLLAAAIEDTCIGEAVAVYPYNIPKIIESSTCWPYDPYLVFKLLYNSYISGYSGEKLLI
jgi:hypothetical protein